MESLDKAFTASMFGKKNKVCRKGASGIGPDSEAAHEARILLYMERANANENEKHERRMGSNNRPLNIFTGVEYTEEELKVEELEDCQDEE